MIKTTTIIILLIFLIPCLSFSQYQNLDDNSAFLKKAENLTQEITTMTSDFVQEKHLSFMSEPIISKGKFKYKVINKIRWEYTHPFNYLLILNDGKLFIDDDGNQNKVDLGNNEMFKQINDIITNALTGNVFDDPDQFDYILEESSDNFRVNLTPKKKELQDYISEIKIILPKNTMLVKEVIMIESAEDYTKLSFINTELNDTIDNNIFELKQN